MTAPTRDDDTTPDTPDDAPAPPNIRVTLGPDEWEFSEATADITELVDLELATGWTTGEWQDNLNRGSARAMMALVWLLRRRTDPNLALNAVRFKVGELNIEFVDPGKADSNGS